MKKLWLAMILLVLITAQISGCTEKLPPAETDSAETTTDVEDELISTSAPQTEKTSNPYLENFREVLGNADFCAVAHLGYLDGSYYEIMSHIEDMGMIVEFPFLEIPKENYLALEGGELYAIIPADRDVSVSAYAAELDETNYTVKPGAKLAEYKDGEPILLKCNVSEIMPNVVLKITAKGHRHIYSPTLSGENGRLVQTEGVYDFSPYDVLLAGIADGADYVFCGKWLTSEPDRAGNPLTLLLNLMPDGGAEYAYGPSNSEYTDMYAGTWSYNTQKEMIRLSLEEVRVADDTASDRPLHTLNCGFTWEIDGSLFKLTHTEGDEILDGSWGGTFRFMNGFDFYNEPKG